MTPRIVLLLLTAVALGAGGCENAGFDPGDLSPLPPRVAAPQSYPTTVNIDSLTPASGSYEITLSVSVWASDRDGQADIASVRAEVIRPGGGEAIAASTLRDDGMAPDMTAGDTVFSGLLVFRATRAQVGLHRIRFVAQDRSALRSTGVEAGCNLIRNNTAPALDSLSLAAPDTLLRPASGTLLFRVSIAAQDSDGLSDIQRVFMENLATLTRFTLLDDGGAPQQGGITSGDSLAGDGVFSITFGLPSSAPSSVLHYRLQAVDTQQDTSTSVLYTLVVQ